MVLAQAPLNTASASPSQEAQDDTEFAATCLVSVLSIGKGDASSFVRGSNSDTSLAFKDWRRWKWTLRKLQSRRHRGRPKIGTARYRVFRKLEGATRHVRMWPKFDFKLGPRAGLLITFAADPQDLRFARQTLSRIICQKRLNDCFSPGSNRTSLRHSRLKGTARGP